jgi:hypothetical protein
MVAKYISDSYNTKEILLNLQIAKDMATIITVVASNRDA